MSQPILLDLFCKAGGATRGYQQAGYFVVGVDIKPQKHHCGDEFIQADALEFLADGGWKRFDAIHASPPCQGYSIMRNLPWLREKEYPLLILPVRKMLEHIGLPYVIENVYGARHGSKQLAKRGLEAHGMKAGWLCGTMFGRPFYRHRLFETNFFWLQPGHPKHTRSIRDGRSLGGRARDIVFTEDYDSWPGRRGTLNNGGAMGYGHQKGIALVKEAMEIDWMTRDEITQALPPCYTRFIGEAMRASA